MRYLALIFVLLFLSDISTALSEDFKYIVEFENGTVVNATYVNSSPLKSRTFCVILNEDGSSTSGYYKTISSVTTVW